MRHRSQFAETEKAKRAFDGVNSAENAGQDIAVFGILLERDQVAIEAVEILVTFNQKLFDNIVGIIHKGLLAPSARAASHLRLPALATIYTSCAASSLGDDLSLNHWHLLKP